KPPPPVPKTLQSLPLLRVQAPPAPHRECGDAGNEPGTTGSPAAGLTSAVFPRNNPAARLSRAQGLARPVLAEKHRPQVAHPLSCPSPMARGEPASFRSLARPAELCRYFLRCPFCPPKLYQIPRLIRQETLPIVIPDDVISPLHFFF